MLLQFPVSSFLSSLYEKDFTEFDLVFIGRDGELSVASASLARRVTPRSAAAAPVQTSKSSGLFSDVADVLGVAGALLSGGDD